MENGYALRPLGDPWQSAALDGRATFLRAQKMLTRWFQLCRRARSREDALARWAQWMERRRNVEIAIIYYRLERHGV